MPNENVYTEAHGFKFPNGTTIPIEDAEARKDISEIKQSLSHLSQLDGLAIYKQVIPTEDTASFIANDSMPIIKVTANIEPQQDLHGYDSPWVGGAGKNKLDQSNYNVLYGCSYANNKFTANTMSNLNGAYIRIKNNGAIVDTKSKTVTEGSRVSFSLALDDTWDTIDIGYLMSATNISASFLKSQIGISSGNITVSFKATKLPSTSVYGEFQDIQIEFGNQVTTYEPYSNICPISGWDEANIVVSPTTDAEDGHTYTIDLDGTRYGGTLDVISGVLTITDGYIASYNSETLPSTWISDRDVYTSGGTPTTGAQVVYKLASALNYQLTAQQINVLIGQNYIWADTGSIKEVGYLDILHLS